MRETLPRKKKRGESDSDVISVYFPRDIRLRIDKVAAQTKRSRSGLIVGAVEKWLDAWEQGFHGKPRR